MQVKQGRIVRNGHHHTVAFNITHLTREAEIRHLETLPCPISHLEKQHRAAILKVMLYICIGKSIYFYNQLVERIIITLAYAQWKPGIAPLHLAFNTHGLRLLPEGFLLCIIFHLQQQTLALQGLYG